MYQCRGDGVQEIVSTAVAATRLRRVEIDVEVHHRAFAKPFVSIGHVRAGVHGQLGCGNRFDRLPVVRQGDAGEGSKLTVEVGQWASRVEHGVDHDVVADRVFPVVGID